MEIEPLENKEKLNMKMEIEPLEIYAKKRESVQGRPTTTGRVSVSVLLSGPRSRPIPSHSSTHHVKLQNPKYNFVRIFCSLPHTNTQPFFSTHTSSVWISAAFLGFSPLPPPSAVLSHQISSYLGDSLQSKDPKAFISSPLACFPPPFDW
jgi:hypothetical protein